VALKAKRKYFSVVEHELRVENESEKAKRGRERKGKGEMCKPNSDE
jgi:hypothetical protein